MLRREGRMVVLDLGGMVMVSYFDTEAEAEAFVREQEIMAQRVLAAMWN